MAQKYTKFRVRILHITPHLGGGIGHVLLNFSKHDTINFHSIVTLDYANAKAIDFCSQNTIPLYSQPEPADIFGYILEADIIILHFWNHPLLYNFIVRHTLPASRIIIWSHISGAEVPNIITDKISAYGDIFVFTTPISNEIISKKYPVRVILSTGGVEHVANILHEKHEGFIVGYIGTVDYVKMHPQYIEIHKKISATKFLIVGGDNEKIISQSADNRFHFTGKVDDIKPYLAQMDIFGYLLNPKHYGTAEQVLQEAMAAGVVPVVLNNPCEESLIKHNKTGLVARNLDEYCEYVLLLQGNISLRNKLARQAQEFAKENFSLDKLTSEWNELFDEVIHLPKSIRAWQIHKSNISAYDIFLESIGEHANDFLFGTEDELRKILSESNWQSETKGTPKHYYHFFENDKDLDRISSRC